uniref:Swi3 domain-containing protein n=1 Tax=Heterorhabditis bacteriophora TaxID=37862 RepID=A0A1I7X1W6_HETBA
MRGEVSDLPEGLTEGLSAEKQQEQQLMNKLAASGKLPARPASSFLQKKLQQRVSFDDCLTFVTLLHKYLKWLGKKTLSLKHHDGQPQLPTAE